jgi:hypothetical protein
MGRPLKKKRLSARTAARCKVSMDLLGNLNYRAAKSYFNRQSPPKRNHAFKKGVYTE